MVIRLNKLHTYILILYEKSESFYQDLVKNMIFREIHHKVLKHKKSHILHVEFILAYFCVKLCFDWKTDNYWPYRVTL